MTPPIASAEAGKIPHRRDLMRKSTKAKPGKADNSRRNFMKTAVLGGGGRNRDGAGRQWGECRRSR